MSAPIVYGDSLFMFDIQRAILRNEQYHETIKPFEGEIKDLKKNNWGQQITLDDGSVFISYHPHVEKRLKELRDIISITYKLFFGEPGFNR